MYSLFKRASTLVALATVLAAVALPALPYEMDFFPKFDAKQHFYVQPGSVPKNMDAAFFADMEQRLVSIAKKDEINIYFVCASSDETDANAISESTLNFAKLLWMEWAHQGMPTNKTAIFVLGSNQAENPQYSKFRAWAWYDTGGIPITYLNSTDAQCTFNKSSVACLEQRNCPHQFIRAVTLHLQDECAELAAKNKQEAARKQSEEAMKKKAAEDASQAAKIQAARASDNGNNSAQVIATRDAVEQLKKESVIAIDAVDHASSTGLLIAFAMFGLAGIALYIWARPTSRT